MSKADELFYLVEWIKTSEISTVSEKYIKETKNGFKGRWGTTYYPIKKLEKSSKYISMIYSKNNKSNMT